MAERIKILMLAAVLCIITLAAGQAMACSTADLDRVTINFGGVNDQFTVDEQTGLLSMTLKGISIPKGFMEGTIYLTDGPDGHVSDILTLSRKGKNALRITFISDDGDIPKNFHIDRKHYEYLTESDGWMKLGDFFGLKRNAVEVNSFATPIPAAAWLVGTGFVGLVYRRRRKKK